MLLWWLLGSSAPQEFTSCVKSPQERGRGFTRPICRVQWECQVPAPSLRLSQSCSQEPWAAMNKCTRPRGRERRPHVPGASSQLNRALGPERARRLRATLGGDPSARETTVAVPTQGFGRSWSPPRSWHGGRPRKSPTGEDPVREPAARPRDAEGAHTSASELSFPHPSCLPPAAAGVSVRTTPAWAATLSTQF